MSSKLSDQSRLFQVLQVGNTVTGNIECLERKDSLPPPHPGKPVSKENVPAIVLGIDGPGDAPSSKPEAPVVPWTKTTPLTPGGKSMSDVVSSMSTKDPSKLLLNFKNIEVIDTLPHHVYVKCTKLTLSQNRISSLEGLAKFMCLRQLSLGFNNIKTFKELRHLRGDCLEHLSVEGNPLAAHPHYRNFLIGVFPSLKYIDNVQITDKERRNQRSSNVVAKNVSHALALLSRHIDATEFRVKTAKMKLELMARTYGGHECHWNASADPANGEREIKDVLKNLALDSSKLDDIICSKGNNVTASDIDLVIQNIHDSGLFQYSLSDEQIETETRFVQSMLEAHFRKSDPKFSADPPCGHSSIDGCGTKEGNMLISHGTDSRLMDMVNQLFCSLIKRVASIEEERQILVSTPTFRLCPIGIKPRRREVGDAIWRRLGETGGPRTRELEVSFQHRIERESIIRDLSARLISSKRAVEEKDCTWEAFQEVFHRREQQLKQAHREAVESLQSKLDRATTHTSQLQHENSILSTKIEWLGSNYSQAQLTIAELNEEVGLTSNKNEDLFARNMELQNSLDKSNADVQKLRNELESLRSSHESLIAEKNEIQNRLEVKMKLKEKMIETLDEALTTVFQKQNDDTHKREAVLSFAKAAAEKRLIAGLRSWRMRALESHTLRSKLGKSLFALRMRRNVKAFYMEWHRRTVCARHVHDKLSTLRCLQRRAKLLDGMESFQMLFHVRRIRKGNPAGSEVRVGALFSSPDTGRNNGASAAVDMIANTVNSVTGRAQKYPRVMLLFKSLYTSKRMEQYAMVYAQHVLMKKILKAWRGYVSLLLREELAFDRMAEVGLQWLAAVYLSVWKQVLRTSNTLRTRYNADAHYNRSLCSRVLKSWALHIARIVECKAEISSNDWSPKMSNPFPPRSPHRTSRTVFSKPSPSPRNSTARQIKSSRLSTKTRITSSSGVPKPSTVARASGKRFSARPRQTLEFNELVKELAVESRMVQKRRKRQTMWT